MSDFDGAPGTVQAYNFQEWVFGGIERLPDVLAELLEFLSYLACLTLRVVVETRERVQRTSESKLDYWFDGEHHELAQFAEACVVAQGD